ncbi:hypothetical protein [Pseudoalteromonas sp. MTN2-4]|uniref:hypothetical protein n=1 Tax=Pseudoalteromonas sp. MTN2-4 TaxID=3056555 RepID=UPI0036F1F47C
MRKTAIVVAITALSLSGCKTLDAVPGGLGGLVGSKQVDQAQVQAAYSKAQEAYTLAQTAMQTASSQSLIDYDPDRVQDANKVWSDLQDEFAELQAKPERALDKASLFSSNTIADEVMEQSQNIIALITNAENSKNAIVAVLEPIRAHFLVLDNIETQKSFSKQYAQLVERHDELKSLLIEGEQAKVEGYLPEFSQRLHNLEQDAVEQFYLGEVFSQLKSLANSEKSEVLPSVYANVKGTAEAAQIFARNNVRDYDSIKNKTRLAELQIQRINSLFSEHKLRELALKNESVEAQLLALETQLFQLTQKAGLGDLRHLSFLDQLNELKNAL